MTFHQCHWEGAANAAAGTAAMAACLASDNASAILSAPLYHMTGLWNVEDFLGHLCTLASASAAVYMVLARFGDNHTLRQLFAKWVTYPLTVVIPLLFACFLCSKGSQINNPIFEDLEPDAWLTLYWLLFCGTVIYLLMCTMRVLLVLRRCEPVGAAVNMYLATAALTILTLALLFIHAVTQIYIRDLIWTFADLAVIGWVATPACSWIMKTKALAGSSPREALGDHVRGGHLGPPAPSTATPKASVNPPMADGESDDVSAPHATGDF